MRVRTAIVLSTCVAGIFTPGVLHAPKPPIRTEVVQTPAFIPTPFEKPVMKAEVPVDLNSWNEMGDLSVLEPKLIEHQRAVHGHCGEWYDEAMSVGWKPSEWKRLRYIIARETGNTCDPKVLNDTAATRDLSYGLMQINMRGKLGPDRIARCGLTANEDLWDPVTNLRCARILYERSGWTPWVYTPK